MTAKIGPHQRYPWTADCPKLIFAHCRWDQLKGTYKKSVKEAARGTEIYVRAKKMFDHDAAADLVEKWVSKRAIDKIIDCVIAANKPPVIAIPHPEFDPLEPAGDPLSPTNALPFAFAAYLAAELGGSIETEIVEVARPGRTRLGRFPRFLWQPSFNGTVRQDCAYVLADDNCTAGGTFAALRSHIAANGGTVAAVTALSNGSGKDCPLPIAETTVDVLLSTYSAGITSLWIEEVGHEIKCLTELEGAFLADWGRGPGTRGPEPLQRLRDRLADAAAKAE